MAGSGGAQGLGKGCAGRKQRSSVGWRRSSTEVRRRSSLVRKPRTVERGIITAEAARQLGQRQASEEQ